MDPKTIEPELPGFRFYPTEEELLDFYLKGLLYGKRPTCQIINTVNIYLHEPWELSRLAKIGEREWYFFVPRDKKHANGGRPSRITGTGFWKATGSDRYIRSIKDPKRVIGVRKTLVFYKGRAPKGCRTDWIMNEYRMPDTYPTPKNDVVLCKIYRKATSMKVLEQRAAMEEDKALPKVGFSATEMVSWQMKTSQKEEEINEKKEYEKQCENMSRQRDCMKENLPQLHLPKYNLEWIQDPYLFQSPWIQDWSLCDDLLNF